MTAKVLESFGGKLAEQWVTTLLSPAFIFWLGGFLAAIHRFGWTTLTTQFTFHSEPLQIAILVGCFCGIAVSAFIVQRFDFTTLRFLEGYWHSRLDRIRQRRIRYYRKQRENIEDQRQKLRHTETDRQNELQALKRIIDEQGAEYLSNEKRKRYSQLYEQRLTSTEQATLIQIQKSLRALPRNPSDLMPTRLGNLLRATERRPQERYGLDAIICWSRLWLLLPDTTRKDLQEARAELNNAARLWLWSLLFSVWTLLGAWWAFPISAIAAWFTYYVWILDAANTYADLVDAAFDIHRTLLYKSLRWQLPATAAAEIEAGKQLTEYLWNGSDSDTLQFVQPQKE
jgi:hypothetical protein